ncbi:hypothetical protein [Methylobacterium sp.]|uniref:hypothetical protein n=1 Tax=Methylobacterium sp. TaxID=409 RepID=UPI000FAE781F|nr:hypothetical protein [Methylobacterium sp.]RUP21847.1 MAG: hypothetical protein EKK44_07480 [Methylobacterium sp.]
MTHFTCVRVERIRDRSELARIASHGLRLDPSSKARVDPARTPLNRSGSDYAENPLDLSKALEGFLKANGARLYGRAPIGLHVLVSVSPGWITEVGELHDPQNTRNVQLAQQAVDWVQRALGGGRPCIVAWRQDLDEKGGGVVDIVAAPIRAAKLNRFKDDVTIVSVTAALEAHRALHPKDPTAFGALQTSWAAHAAKTLDRTLRRGTRKVDQPAEHLDPERYGRLVDAARDEAKAIAAQDLAEERAVLDARERRLEIAEEKITRFVAGMAAEREGIMAEARAKVDDALNAIAIGIDALTDGRIVAVDHCAVSGELLLILDMNLDAAERSALWEAITPGLPAGLMTVLGYIQAEAARSGEARNGDHARHPSPSHF